MFTNLPTDLKSLILTNLSFINKEKSLQLWTKLALYDKSFKNYTINNRIQFINIFTEEIEDDNNCLTNYMIFNRFHRENDLPAVIYYLEDMKDFGCWTRTDIVASEEWWQNGLKHRIGKPAVINYGREYDNLIEFIEYWEYGVYLGDKK